MSKRGHLPTGHGPTLPIPRRGDLQDRRRGGGGKRNCGKRHSAERGGGRCGSTHVTDGAPLATEIAPSLERETQRDTPLPTEQKMLEIGRAHV